MIIGQLGVDNVVIEMKLIAIGRCGFYAEVDWLLFGDAIIYYFVKIVMFCN